MNINYLSTRTNTNNNRRKQEQSQTNTDTEDRRQGHHNSLKPILMFLSRHYNCCTFTLIFQISKCNIESLQGTFHLQRNLQQLSVHNSLHLLKVGVTWLLLIDHSPPPPPSQVDLRILSFFLPTRTFLLIKTFGLMMPVRKF